MKWAGRLALFVMMATTVFAVAADKKAAVAGKMVDSGSFGVYVNGKRVATETFQIEQLPDSSITKSEVRADEAKAVQNSEMVLTTNGNLRRYTWNEVSPSKAQSVIEPQEQVLMQHITGGVNDKPVSQQYILPTSTVILDDYFFSQREILAWRYLAGSCRPEPGNAGCKLARAQFGALIPRQRTSLLVNIEYVGKEMVNVHGQKRELSRFNLQSEGLDWGLWLDENHKLIRVYIKADATEVVRD
jgi:hypothetical protein